MGGSVKQKVVYKLTLNADRLGPDSRWVGLQIGKGQTMAVLLNLLEIAPF